MKKFLLFIIFSFVCIYSQAQKNQTIQTKEIKVSETANDSCKTSQTNKIYEVDAVDQMPSFPGGPKKFERYLNTHVSYPVDAQENGIQGRVLVQFNAMVLLQTCTLLIPLALHSTVRLCVLYQKCHDGHQEKLMVLQYV